MKVGDVNCPECNAGFRRIELSSSDGRAERVPLSVCDNLIEVSDASKEVSRYLEEKRTGSCGSLISESGHYDRCAFITSPRREQRSAQRDSNAKEVEHRAAQCEHPDQGAHHPHRFPCHGVSPSLSVTQGPISKGV